MNAADRARFLLEEYRALNGLLLFRLNALDRRVPIAAAFFVTPFASYLTLPADLQNAVCITLPLVTMCLVRTTLQHAISKEDHLKRISEIELAINRLAGEQLMVFQSLHPRRKAKAGRTGRQTLMTTLAYSVAALVACVVLVPKQNTIFVGFYLLYVAGAVTDMVNGLRKASNYGTRGR